jgi:predicted Fe-Mo cluster-binding NifX family protein
MSFTDELSERYVHLDEVSKTLKKNAYHFLRRRGVTPLKGTQLYRRSDVIQAIERGTLESKTKNKKKSRVTSTTLK